MKPFLKWAGGKRQLLNRIVPLLPDFTDYYEPFLGGGSLYFHLQPTFSILSDINEELINCYDRVKHNKENDLYPITTFVMVSIVNSIWVFLVIPVFFPVLIYEKLTK